MDRNLALEFVRVTEAAAISAAKWIGKGDKNAADQAAVDAMRSRFFQFDFGGTVVIGEGKKDKAPMLYTGEKVGKGKAPVMDLAIDPLECTDSVAHGKYNAISVIASGASGSLLNAPDIYMDNIAVGPKAKNAISLAASTKDNIEKVAKALGKKVEDITVMILDRERHTDMINDIRKAGARVRLITDGTVAGAIVPSLEDGEIDMLMGIGGSTESVLAAVAIKILGGEILARFNPQKESHLKELEEIGIKDVKKIYTSEDLAQGNDLTFTATGIIEGPLLRGVEFKTNSIVTHSIVIRGASKTVRYITTHHQH